MAIKPVIKTVNLPKGYTGVITMMWVVLAYLIINKKGSSFLFSFLQSLLALCLGIGAKFGLWIFVIYLGPGLVTDLVMVIPIKDRVKSIIAGAAANITGTLLVMLVLTKVNALGIIYYVPVIISGALGGYLAVNVKAILIRKKAIRHKKNVA